MKIKSSDISPSYGLHKILKNARDICPFFKNTGVVKTINLTDNYGLPDGAYALSWLIDNFGVYYPCCEGCLIIN